MNKYMILCELYETEDSVDKLVFYMKNLEDAKKAKELFDSILSDWCTGQWTVDICNDEEEKRVMEIIEELIELGVSFEQEAMSYFIPPITKISVLEYKIIS